MSSDPWLEKTQWGQWEVNPMNHEITVNVCGDQKVEIDKLYGSQCSSSIRVWHDLTECQWVVQEQNFNNDEWVERARFDAQEFYKPEYQTDSEEESKE